MLRTPARAASRWRAGSCRGVSGSLTKRGYCGYATVLASDPPAELMDALQYAAAAGCFDHRAQFDAAVVVDDVAGDERWPDLAASMTGDSAVRAV